MTIKRNIRLMYAIAFLQGMVFYGPVATLYRQAAGVSIFQITIIESISMALCVLLELPWGVAADRIGYKKTIVFCCGLYFISKIVFWKAAGFWEFLLERMMLSVSLAGLSGVDISVLYLSCGKERTQEVFGRYNNLSTAGLIFAAGVFSLLIKDDYRLAGFLTVISYGAASFLTLWLREVKPAGSAKRGKASAAIFGQLAKNKYLLPFLVAVALLNETHQTVTVFLSQLQYVRCGLSNAAMGYVYIAATVLGLLGGFSACLTKKLGTMPLAGILFGAGTAACTVLALSDSAFLSVPAIFLLRVGFSLFQPLQTELQNRQVASADRATALSLNAVLMDGVAIATNVIFGKLAQIRLSLAMMLGACFCLLGFLLFSLWYGRCRHIARTYI